MLIIYVQLSVQKRIWVGTKSGVNQGKECSLTKQIALQMTPGSIFVDQKTHKYMITSEI